MSSLVLYIYFLEKRKPRFEARFSEIDATFFEALAKEKDLDATEETSRWKADCEREESNPKKDFRAKSYLAPTKRKLQQ